MSTKRANVANDGACFRYISGVPWGVGIPVVGRCGPVLLLLLVSRFFFEGTSLRGRWPEAVEDILVARDALADAMDCLASEEVGEGRRRREE